MVREKEQIALGTDSQVSIHAFMYDTLAYLLLVSSAAFTRNYEMMNNGNLTA